MICPACGSQGTAHASEFNGILYAECEHCGCEWWQRYVWKNSLKNREVKK